MKKILLCVISVMCLFALTACGQNEPYELKIRIPAGADSAVYQEDFAFSDEEISPKSGKITISAGEGLSDTEVVLKPISVKEENAYEPTYLTPGMPVTMDVEKGAWFKVGVNVPNPTDEEIVVTVIIDGVKSVRIE